MTHVEEVGMYRIVHHKINGLDVESYMNEPDATGQYVCLRVKVLGVNYFVSHNPFKADWDVINFDVYDGPTLDNSILNALIEYYQLEFLDD